MNHKTPPLPWALDILRPDQAHPVAAWRKPPALPLDPTEEEGLLGILEARVGQTSRALEPRQGGSGSIVGAGSQPEGCTWQRQDLGVVLAECFQELVHLLI